MGFIKLIFKSIYSPEFYSQLPGKGLDRAIGYFLLLILLLTAFRAAPLIYSFAKDGQPEIQRSLTKISNIYPQELEVKIKNGQVTTNAEEPYIIATPEGFDGEAERYNIMVIDTKTPFSVSQFEKYNAFSWLSKDVVYLKGDGKEFRAYDLSDVSDVTINKKQVTTLLSKITPWLTLLTPAIGVVLFIGIFFAYLFRLIYIFFLALIIFLLMKLMNKPLTYKNAYKVGIHAVTLSLFVELAQKYIPGAHVPFLFTLIALGVVFINYNSQKNQMKSPKKRAAKK